MKHIFLQKLPNILSLSRGLLLPLVLWLLIQEAYGECLLLVIFLSLTDWLDGFLARRWNVSTATGALLDAVVDRVFVVVLSLLLALFVGLPIWYASILFVKNLSQILAVPLLNWLKIPFKVRPKLLPKWATATSFFVLCLYLFLFWAQRTLSFDSGGHLFNVGLTNLFGLLMLLSAVLEAYIFLTFCMRLTQIVRRQHDTFE